MPSCEINCHPSLKTWIPCAIGNSIFEKAFFDLEATINLMSLSIFKKLNLGEARPIMVTLQLANRPLLIIEGLLRMYWLKLISLSFRWTSLFLTWRNIRRFQSSLEYPFWLPEERLLMSKNES